MIEIRPLLKLDADDIERVITEHSTQECYRVNYSDSDEQTTFSLQLVSINPPRVGKYHHFDAAELERYAGMLKNGYAFGAYEGDILQGFIIAEAREWNDSVWVWEFHVAGLQRGKGIGRGLMERIIAKAKSDGLRMIFCETQNTNVSAIKAYRKLGFRMEGIDISYYTNNDFPDGEMAVFMKLRL